MRLHQLSGNVVYFLNRQEQKLRPFVTADLGCARYSPTSAARDVAAPQQFIEGPAALSNSNKLDFNFGAGAQWKFTRVLGPGWTFATT